MKILMLGLLLVCACMPKDAVWAEAPRNVRWAETPVLVFADDDFEESAVEAAIEAWNHRCGILALTKDISAAKITVHSAEDSKSGVWKGRGPSVAVWTPQNGDLAMQYIHVTYGLGRALGLATDRNTSSIMSGRVAVDDYGTPAHPLPRPTFQDLDALEARYCR